MCRTVDTANTKSQSSSFCAYIPITRSFFVSKRSWRDLILNDLDLRQIYIGKYIEINLHFHNSTGINIHGSELRKLRTALHLNGNLRSAFEMQHIENIPFGETEHITQDSQYYKKRWYILSGSECPRVLYGQQCRYFAMCGANCKLLHYCQLVLSYFFRACCSESSLWPNMKILVYLYCGQSRVCVENKSKFCERIYDSI